jgi:hypothetical protein
MLQRLTIPRSTLVSTLYGSRLGLVCCQVDYALKAAQRLLNACVAELSKEQTLPTTKVRLPAQGSLLANPLDIPLSSPQWGQATQVLHHNCEARLS